MGSLESGLPLKRDHHLLRSSSVRNTNGLVGQRGRSRFAKVLLLKQIDYLQLICAVVVFFFFVFLFQIFYLPGSVIEDGIKFQKAHVLGEVKLENFSFLKEFDFGEDINFEPLKIPGKLRKGDNVVNDSNVVRFGYRKPKIALVSIENTCFLDICYLVLVLVY